MDADELAARRDDINEIINADPISVTVFRHTIAEGEQELGPFTGRLIFGAQRRSVTAESRPSLGVPEKFVAEYPWLMLAHWNDLVANGGVKPKDELRIEWAEGVYRHFIVGFVTRFKWQQEVLCTERG